MVTTMWALALSQPSDLVGIFVGALWRGVGWRLWRFGNPAVFNSCE